MPRVGDRGRYSVAGRCGNSTRLEAIANLWNPHATKSIWVRRITVDCPVAGSGVQSYSIQRTTDRGASPTTTVTPDIDNDFLRLEAPISGVLLDMGIFTTSPTLDASVPWRSAYEPTQGGNAFDVYFEMGWMVPAGTGLAVARISPVSTGGDVTYEWDE